MDAIAAALNDPMSARYAELALRLIAAIFLGALLGIDRDTKNKPLGVRTYGLVSIGACGFAIISLELAALADSQPGIAAIDPSRVVQGLIGGVGFLGAGAIFRSDDSVSGTATGAGIWAAGVVGLSCGFGFFLFAAMVLVSTWLMFAALGTMVKLFAEKIEEEIKPD